MVQPEVTIMDSAGSSSDNPTNPFSFAGYSAQIDHLRQTLHQQMEIITYLTQQVTQLSNTLTQLTTAAMPPPAFTHQSSLAQHTSLTQEPPIPDPEPFHGEGDKCRGFMLQCRCVFDQQPRAFCSDRTKINFVINRLRGRALTWAEVADSQGRFIRATIEEFFHDLRTSLRVHPIFHVSQMKLSPPALSAFRQPWKSMAAHGLHCPVHPGCVLPRVPVSMSSLLSELAASDCHTLSAL
uniref:DUF4939 domain-containing protein n=1 Tax=Monopterus albus TaxID=43700 RepID=A0A3Q3IWE0_MONAL